MASMQADQSDTRPEIFWYRALPESLNERFVRSTIVRGKPPSGLVFFVMKTQAPRRTNPKVRKEWRFLQAQSLDNACEAVKSLGIEGRSTNPSTQARELETAWSSSPNRLNTRRPNHPSLSYIDACYRDGDGGIGLDMVATGGRPLADARRTHPLAHN